MRAIFQNTRSAEPGSQQNASAAQATADGPRPAPRIDWNALKTAERSCCCTARPVVVAVLPPTPGRLHRTDLLFCMHHFRASRETLTARGAAIFDLNGKRVPPDAPAYLGTASLQPAN